MAGWPTPVVRERIRTRVIQMLEARQQRLPTRFEVEVVGTDERPRYVVVRLAPDRPTGVMHCCEQVFLEICELVNREFENDRGYVSIEFDVPYDFLGDLGVQLSIETTERGQRARLKRGEHG